MDDPMMPNDYTDEFFIDHLKSHNPNGDILESFLEDIAENTPSWNTKKIQQLASNSESICSPGIITIDDREYNTSERRNYAKDLSAEDCLALPRFGHEEYPDADRRLISASKLDSSVLLTLVRTSHCHQVGPLREALAKHISCKTYLRAYESYDGYPTPYLELQLPWLALRELSDDGTGSSGDEATQKPWSDVPLPVESSKGKTKYGRFAIYRGHVTLLAIKWNDRKSTIYRFHKACPFGPEISESDASQSQDGISDDEDEENEIDPEPEEDILVPPGGGYDLDANTPIWDMEKYFLRCAAIWARLAVREYTTLVRTLEESVDAWNDVLSLPALNPSCDEQVEHTSRLHKIVDTMQLLSKICQDLQLATQTWEGFIAPDGDLAFFGDLTDPDVRRPYRDLKSSFRELGILEKALKHRHTTCKELARRLQLQLALTSNILSYRSIDLSRHAHDLNLETNLIGREVHQLNRINTEAALANVAVAKETTQSSRNSVLVIWLTTPLVLVLQYFGADRPIFPGIAQSPKNFVISLCILFPFLPLLVYMINTITELITRMKLIKPKNHPNSLADRTSLGHETHTNPA